MLKAHNIEDDSRMNPEFADRLKQLDKEASYYRDECGKAQAEVDRLLEILKEVENEKNDKDKKIAELERWVKGEQILIAWYTFWVVIYLKCTLLHSYHKLKGSCVWGI